MNPTEGTPCSGKEGVVELLFSGQSEQSRLTASVKYCYEVVVAHACR